MMGAETISGVSMQLLKTEAWIVKPSWGAKTEQTDLSLPKTHHASQGGEVRTAKLCLGQHVLDFGVEFDVLLEQRYTSWLCRR